MDATLVDLLPAYRRNLESLCYAGGTVLRYMHEATSFSEFAWHRGRIWPQTVRAADLEAWQKALLDSGRCALSTVITRMRGLRAFFSYLGETGVVRRDPFVGYPVPRLPATLPRDVLTVAEALRLVHAPAGRTSCETQDVLMLEVLYATGLRVSELCSLEASDLDLARRLVHVRHGKGAKDRVVPVGRATATRLKFLLTERELSTGSDTTQPVFVSHHGRRVTPATVLGVLRRETARCRITKHVTPHTLRHTCATHMHSRGAGIFHIKGILGHADVTTTQIYTRVAPREAQRTHRNKHPRERAARRLLRQGRQLPQSDLERPKPDAAFVAAAVAPLPAVGQRYGTIPDDGPLDAESRRWVAAYEDHLHLLNRNERTIHAHVARLLFFLRFAASRGVHSCLAVDRQLLLDYRAHLGMRLKRRKTDSGTAVRNQFLAVALCFFRFLAYREALAVNPGYGVRYAREPLKLPCGVPSPTDISHILDQPDINTPMGLRDRAILEVLYSCGLRKEELIAVSMDALDMDEGRLSVWAGKGKKDRVVPIGTMAIHFVRQYRDRVRPILVRPGTPSEWLFLSMRGRRLSKNSLLCMVHKYAVSAGITPHAFRHAFASHLIQNGADLRHVQEMLGHAKISSTQVYVHLTIPDLRRIHRTTHPIG